MSPEIMQLAHNLALRRITLQITRDGEQTASEKAALLLQPNSLVMQAAFVARDGYSDSQLFLASAVDGMHLLLATDEVAPKRAAARYPTIGEDVTLSLDLNDGSGAAAGSPATLQARVRVDGLDAAREVLAVERQTDGVWRIAGSLRTADGSLDLRVTGGAVYALAIDDYGTLYQPNLAVAVGDVIRPSTFAGWLYRITQAGSLPASEPAWWDGNTAGPQDLGSARAEVVRYHRPLAHGPIAVEML
ncbi:hypothetical protein V2S84_08980 [Azotobacter chroococcum]|nr:hypothetical protein [Azotobacter chroococcum]